MNSPCHRCDYAGLIWVTPEGQVVARDHLDAYAAFACSHDGRMAAIKDIHHRWVKAKPNTYMTAVRVKPGGNAKPFEARR